MKKFIENTDMVYWLVGLLCLLHIGSYSQLIFPENWVKLRDILLAYGSNNNISLGLSFYYLYWVATIASIILVLVICVFAIFKLIISIKKQKK